ncbi:helix-turn-helix transcriptional regulator [Parabacteroides sp. GYB001]|uniref:helix-turn-helix transcriptional regulator n=1 Tax=Parabacteroides leei TaxID=2939491 RepID=UPI0020171CA6|nr:helix-turn-helix transcriptional regulator [Parabacteroides leei]MCL3854386.1 helix-turn-helix transcriptional regulator [Parabacteroides leei]
MDIVNKLNDELLKQTFTEEQQFSDKLNECKLIASTYALIENSIAVLSDMKTNTSYIYYGGMAEKLGVGIRGGNKVLYSIWEEEIFNRIHPDDLLEKHLQELRFLDFLRNIPEKERADYHIASHIRMRDTDDQYVRALHRMFYIASHSNGSIRLSLCLYNLSADPSLNSVIINSADGQTLELQNQTCNEILSAREIEILRLIDQGMMSKEIASTLSRSINTINKHRQNILEKLHVSNSIEACRIAKGLKLI